MAASGVCPFNSRSYVASLSHLGEVAWRPSSPAAIIRRPVPRSDAFDGLGPWPYLWVNDPSDVETLRDAFADFLTLTFVTQPGFRPHSQDSDALHLKDHFIYDPALPFPEFSKRTLKHLRRSAESWEFDVVTGFEDRLVLQTLYDGLKERRGLAGGFFDFANVHFETLARMKEAVFFSARDQAGVEAVVCAIAFGEWIVMFHNAATERGLRSDVSYFLMNAILAFAKRENKKLILGGIPRGANDGLSRFKARWSNRSEPVFLHRIVNDRAAYNKLVRWDQSSGYFPAYRSAAWPQDDAPVQSPLPGSRIADLQERR